MGPLTEWCPPELVDKAIDECGGQERRRRLLSARTMVYFELARCLHPGQGYAQVFEHLLPDDVDLYLARRGFRVPNKSSLCRARSRLGVEVMEAVFRLIAGPVAEEATCPSAFWRGLRLEAFDGTVLDVADTAENAVEFTRPAGSCGAGGYPQARVVALVECGTHALIDAAIGGRKQGETTLAMRLAASAGSDTLVLADRGMLGVPLWTAFTDAGAQLLWRIKKDVAVKSHARLEDGTYLACIRLDKNAAAALRRAGKTAPGPITVRVIEYTLPGSDELYRLATSLLDPATAPATELAMLYHERWESEGAFAEIKSAQRGSRVVLRSGNPAGVRQEIRAHPPCTTDPRSHSTSRDRVNPPLDPERISFRHAQQLVRRNLATTISPSGQHRQYAEQAAARLTARPNPKRRPRSYPRTIKRRASRVSTTRNLPRQPIPHPSRRE